MKETKAKIRFGRIILIVVVLAGAYWILSWVQNNADTIASMDKNMQTLSSQLEDQKEQVRSLNRTLSKFSAGLGQLQQNINVLQDSINVQGQTANHSLKEISNNVLNMKGKLDVLSQQSSRGGYFR